eukprot:SAG31_NODE_1368_length_8614_cov_12.018203_3_plen_147_part_00
MLEAAKEKTREFSSTLEASTAASLAMFKEATDGGVDAREFELDLGENKQRFPNRQGYLEKQKKKGAKEWQTRWFVLSAGRLDYFKSKKDASGGVSPLGTIWATNILLVRFMGGADRACTFAIEVYRDEKPQNPVRTLCCRVVLRKS